MKWFERIARQMSDHSDYVAVVRYGNQAKRATRRRSRREGKTEARKAKSQA